jgi:HSP20 family protein
MNAILRRDPISTIFDDFFGDYFTRGLRPVAAPSAAPTLARLDVSDQGDSYRVTVDLPGVRKEDIHVTVEGAHVAIRAETKAETTNTEQGKLIYAERRGTVYARSFELPVEVTQEQADASYENGVLTLVLPKRQTITSQRLTVR